MQATGHVLDFFLAVTYMFNAEYYRKAKLRKFKSPIIPAA